MSTTVMDYTVEDLYQYTNAELREMGLPDPCECADMYVDYDEGGKAFNVCPDCGASYLRPSARSGDRAW